MTVKGHLETDGVKQKKKNKWCLSFDLWGNGKVSHYAIFWEVESKNNLNPLQSLLRVFTLKTNGYDISR